MTALRKRLALSGLMGAASLIALTGPAAAQDAAELENRIEVLEAKLDAILDRMETADTMVTPAEAQTLRETSTLLKTTSAPAPAPQPVIHKAVVRPATSVAATNVATVANTAAPANGFQMGDTSITLGGYVKVDATVTDFDGGDVPTNSLGRDFYIPGLVPVGGDGSGAEFDFNPRETRLVFGLKPNRGGMDIGGKIEMDFQVTNDGNERVSNSFAPRMRQAYITVDNWLIGQAWSTFQDVAALPENLDFIGPTEGTVFIRQPMIRYKSGPVEVAIEQPETEITSPTGGRLLPGDDRLPDVTARYTSKGDWGHFTVAGLLRNLHVEEGLVALGEGSVSQDDDALGYGVSVAGKLKLGTGGDDFRYMLTAGDGVGRYIGVNVVNDAAINGDGELETIGTVSGFASYRKVWNSKWRSNFTGGYFKADNPVEFTGEGVTDTVYSGHVNLIYKVAPKLDVGAEYIYANREVESGLDGSMNKLQFSAKYGF